MKLIIYLLLIIKLLAAKIKTRIHNQMLKEEEEKGPTDRPLAVNITYENPMHDINEQRKYAADHLAFIKRTKQVESKLYSDIENLKMVMNVQNIQIEKINEIFYTNLAVLYQKLANDYKNKYMEKKVIDGFSNEKKEKDKDGKPIEKPPIKVDFNNKQSVNDFKNLLLDRGVIKPEAVGEAGEHKDVYFNVLKNQDVNGLLNSK